jgi:hypothetical protein
MPLHSALRCGGFVWQDGWSRESCLCIFACQALGDCGVSLVVVVMFLLLCCCGRYDGNDPFLLVLFQSMGQSSTAYRLTI